MKPVDFFKPVFSKWYMVTNNEQLLDLCTFFETQIKRIFSTPRVAKKAGICLLTFPYSCRTHCDAGYSVSIIQRQWHGRRD